MRTVCDGDFAEAGVRIPPCGAYEDEDKDTAEEPNPCKAGLKPFEDGFGTILVGFTTEFGAGSSKSGVTFFEPGEE